METPPSLMTALEELDITTHLSLLPMMKEHNVVHYTVKHHVPGEETLDGFFVTVDINKEESRVYNSFNQLIFTGYGGILKADEKLSVFSALNFFRKELISIEKKSLTLNAEKTSVVECSLHYSEEFDSFSLVKKGDSTDPKMSWCAAIRTNFDHTLLIVKYRSATLSSFERGLALMTAIKFMHCYYSVHCQPMPTRIPHLSPPGTPKEPLSMLQSVRSLQTRTHCKLTPKHQQIVELFDCQTNTILLVAETSEKPHVDARMKAISFKDEFGIPQFQIDDIQPNHDFKIFDSKMKMLCEVKDGGTLELGEQGTFRINRRLENTRHVRKGIHRFHCMKGESYEIDFFVKSEWPVVYIRMNPDFSVQCKASILAFATYTAIFSFHILRLVFKNVTDTYLYREIAM